MTNTITLTPIEHAQAHYDGVRAAARTVQTIARTTRYDAALVRRAWVVELHAARAQRRAPLARIRAEYTRSLVEVAAIEEAVDIVAALVNESEKNLREAEARANMTGQ